MTCVAFGDSLAPQFRGIPLAVSSIMRIASSLLFSCLIALHLFAADVAPARFFIERIEVRNASRVSPELVISESLLREGNEYSEADLADAAARLNRLPFLLSADMALEKGSDRGRHVLVISVVETKPLFFLVDGRAVLNEDAGAELADVSDPAMSAPSDAAAGFRWFVGGRGIVHAGVTIRDEPHRFARNYAAPSVGYTQYDLFGTRALATINLRLPWGRWAGRLSPQFIIAVPVTPTQTVSAMFEETHFRNDTGRLIETTFDERDAERRVSLSWTYNSTNEPFVPTRGTIVSLTAIRSMNDRADAHVVPAPGVIGVVEPYARHNNATGVDLTLSRYWELSEKNSVHAAFIGGWSRVEQRLNAATSPLEANARPTYEIARAGWSRSLWHGDPRNGDSRVEVDVHFLARQLNVQGNDEAFGTIDREKSAMQVSTSWVRRSAYGTLRLGLGYAWGE